MGRQSLVSVVVLALMVIMLTGLGGKPMVVEAGHGHTRICESLSHKFKGPCVSSSNCGSVCHTEGFHGGDCRGFRRRCFCTKPCS